MKSTAFPIGVLISGGVPAPGSINYSQGHAMSNHHGLHSRIQRRFVAGFSVIGSYAYSRAFDLSADEQQGGTIDPSDLNREFRPQHHHLRPQQSQLEQRQFRTDQYVRTRAQSADGAET